MHIDGGGSIILFIPDGVLITHTHTHTHTHALSLSLVVKGEG